MGLEEVLKKAAGYIRSGRLNNKDQVKQAVIVPVLRELDWEDTDTDEVRVSIFDGKVDYGIYKGQGSPQVFIKVAQRGEMDIQPPDDLLGEIIVGPRPIWLLILTDGDIWKFHLTEVLEGNPQVQQFYCMKLTDEARIPEYVEALEKYLRKGRVFPGEAESDAQKKSKGDEHDEQIKILSERIAEEVEKVWGKKPSREAVEKFLRDFLSESDPSEPQNSDRNIDKDPQTEAMKLSSGSLCPKRNQKNPRIVGFVLHNKEFILNNGVKTLAEVLKEFDRRDSTFMDRFATKTDTPKQRLVARDRKDLYVSSPHLIDNSLNLGNGWWLRTTNNSDQKRKYIKIACEVAGVKFGTQFQLKLVGGESSSASRRGKARSRLLGFVLYGKEVKLEDKVPSYQVMAKILKEFGRRDSEFMDRFADETETLEQNNPRRGPPVARNREDLFSSNPHHYIKLENGWLMASNFSVRRMRGYIKIACEVAGVKFGSELKLIER